jgi:hypothetical protein
VVGRLIDVMACKYREYWPDEEPTPRGQLLAVLADLRHLEGFLAHYLGTAYPLAPARGGRTQLTTAPSHDGTRSRRWGAQVVHLMQRA